LSYKKFPSPVLEEGLKSSDVLKSGGNLKLPACNIGLPFLKFREMPPKNINRIRRRFLGQM
jgi:hypothetical protein